MRRRLRRILPVLGMLTGLGLMLPAALPLTNGRFGDAPAAGVVPPATSRPSRPPAPANSRAGVPVSVRIPALRVDAPVVPVAADATGGLTIPDDPDVLGWWRYGARPGAPTGTVTIAGHVDTAADGPGALFHLETLTPRATVEVRTTAGTIRYRVAARRAYRKQQLPPEVFATAGQPRLVLITCGGRFNRTTHSYADNVVVYALPAPSPAP